MFQRILCILLMMLLALSLAPTALSAEPEDLDQIKAEIWRLIPAARERTIALTRAAALSEQAAIIEAHARQASRNLTYWNVRTNRAAYELLLADPQPTYEELLARDRALEPELQRYQEEPQGPHTHQQHLDFLDGRADISSRISALRIAMANLLPLSMEALGRKVQAWAGVRWQAEADREELANLRAEIAGLHQRAEELRPTAERVHALQERAFQMLTAGLPEQPVSIDVILYRDGSRPTMRVGDRETTVYTTELLLAEDGRVWTVGKGPFEGTGLWRTGVPLLTRYQTIADMSIRDWLGHEVQVLRGPWTDEAQGDCSILLVYGEERKCVRARSDAELPLGLVLRGLRWREERIDAADSVIYRFTPPTRMLDIDPSSALMDRLGEVGIRVLSYGMHHDEKDTWGEMLGIATIAGEPFNYRIWDTKTTAGGRPVYLTMAMMGIQEVQGCTYEGDETRVAGIPLKNTIEFQFQWVEVSARMNLTCEAYRDRIMGFRRTLERPLDANYTMYYVPARVRLGLDHSLEGFHELYEASPPSVGGDLSRLGYVQWVDGDLLDFVRRGGKPEWVLSLWRGTFGAAISLSAEALTNRALRLALPYDYGYGTYSDQDPVLRARFTELGLTRHQDVREFVESIVRYGRAAVYFQDGKTYFRFYDMGWLAEFELEAGYKGVRPMAPEAFEQMVKGAGGPGVGLEIFRLRSADGLQ